MGSPFRQGLQIVRRARASALVSQTIQRARWLVAELAGCQGAAPKFLRPIAEKRHDHAKKPRSILAAGRPVRLRNNFSSTHHGGHGQRNKEWDSRGERGTEAVSFPTTRTGCEISFPHDARLAGKLRPVRYRLAPEGS